jgi:DNA helicase-2/ATP-dependent DNA helicase PcrA
MPSKNRIIIASAGSGKTTSIVTEAGGNTGKRSALITFTNKNHSELRKKSIDLYGHVPAHVTVSTWYRFLLWHFIRPYQRHLYEPKICTLEMVDGRSAKYSRNKDIRRHYISPRSEGAMYMDKASKFAYEVIKLSQGLPIQRITRIYDHIYIDESQDLAGYDLDLLDQLIRADMELTLVGDIRQATYRTNQGRRNSKYVGPNIAERFEEWAKQDGTEIEYQTHSYRCVQSVCDFADSFYPDLPRTKSLNTKFTGHDGVFAVRKKEVECYISKYKPQPLRLKKTSLVIPGCPLNYGEAKGMGFERVLLFPHPKLLDVIKSGDVMELGASNETRAKVYVGITRAYQSIGIVVPDDFVPADIPFYSPEIH